MGVARDFTLEQVEVLLRDLVEAIEFEFLMNRKGDEGKRTVEAVEVVREEVLGWE